MATSKYSYGCTQFPSSNLEWKTTCEIIPHLEKKTQAIPKKISYEITVYSCLEFCYFENAKR